MGSYAGLDLLDYALRHGNPKSDSEFPRVLYYNLPIEGMNETGLKDEKKVFGQLRVAIDGMQHFGCQRAVIACNSAHTFWAKLQGFTPMVILNMVDIGANACCGKGPVGVLCSETSKRSGLYDTYFNRYRTEFIHTNKAEQEEVNDLIGQVICGPFSPGGLLDVCRALVGRGAKTLLAGCTEVEMAVRQSGWQLPFVFPGTLTVDIAING